MDFCAVHCALTHSHCPETGGPPKWQHVIHCTFFTHRGWCCRHNPRCSCLRKCSVSAATSGHNWIVVWPRAGGLCCTRIVRYPVCISIMPVGTPLCQVLDCRAGCFKNIVATTKYDCHPLTSKFRRCNPPDADIAERVVAVVASLPRNTNIFPELPKLELFQSSFYIPPANSLIQPETVGISM